MIIEAKNKRRVSLRRLCAGDTDNLCNYLQGLGSVTKSRFGPHGFDKQSILDFYKHQNEHLGYIGIDVLSGRIIAYSVLKIGYIQNDSFRLQSYSLVPDHHNDCTFAPSLADLWQSYGVGNALFRYLLSDLQSKGIKRIILWGGVQSDNVKAISFYLKNGFKLLGRFEYNGWNDDMILDILQNTILR